MKTLIIDRKTLPKTLFSYIQSEKIKVSEKNGNIVLSPVENKTNVDKLFGKYNKLSSKDFIKQKAIEKELED